MAESAGSYKTIPLRPNTWERLRDYKLAGATYDEVLNDLMDAVPVERFARRLVRRHEARLKDFEGKPWRDLGRK